MKSGENDLVDIILPSDKGDAVVKHAIDRIRAQIVRFQVPDQPPR